MKSTYCIRNCDLSEVNTYSEAEVNLFTGPAPFDTWSNLSVLPKEIDWVAANQIVNAEEIDNIILNFVEDTTHDNAVFMVQSIINKYLDHLRSS